MQSLLVGERAKALRKQFIGSLATQMSSIRRIAALHGAMHLLRTQARLSVYVRLRCYAFINVHIEQRLNVLPENTKHLDASIVSLIVS